MTSKLFLKVFAAIGPMCVAAPAIALPIQPPTGLSPSPNHPLLAQAYYYPGYYKRQDYRRPSGSYNLNRSCSRLGIDVWFCQEWLQEINAYRRAWGVPNSSRLLNQLSSLSLTVRRKLGTYSTQDINEQDRWLQALGFSPQVLDALADQRFHRMFPERRGLPITKGEEMTGQIWQAIREEEVLRSSQSFWQQTQTQ